MFGIEPDSKKKEPESMVPAQIVKKQVEEKVKK